ncbi:glycosyltransferase family 9 protein, partial [bacterium]|nr:glycosyltransferase family 9 protein [bacterium]
QSARNLDIVRIIGADSVDLHETVHVTAGEKDEIRRRFPELYGGTGPVVGFHIGANKKENRWPLARFAELRDMLHRAGLKPPAVFWGPAEKDLGSEFLRLVKRPVHAVEPGNLREQAVHFALCDAVICNDTGVMHLCASVGTPLVALFGPTDPEFWKPVGDSFIALRSRDRRTESVSAVEVRKALFKILGKGRKWK